MAENQIKYECQNAMYFKSKVNYGDDIVLVKEKQHHPDGSIIPYLRVIKNFQKPIYIHKPAYRTYQDKRVWGKKSEMDIYYSTEAKLGDTIKRALGLSLNRYMPMREICRSPYVYGTDISSTSIIKKRYKDKYPDAISDATVAVLDIETNVMSPQQEIIAITLSFGEKAILATTKDFLGSTPDPVRRFFEKLDELLPEIRKPYEYKTYLDKKGKEVKERLNRNCNVEFVIAETPALAVMEVFKRAHQWKPDFITGWNLMGFDIPRIVDCLMNEGYQPEDVFSDPSIPREYREYKYHKGATQKKTSSGKMTPLAGYEQWHWVSVPASFFFIDAMCTFFSIRRGSGLEENYKLDTILNKYIGRGKVGIPEADHLDGVNKHKFMQTRYKLEYLVYNLFDCVGVEMLDEKTKDLSKVFSVLAGVSDFGNFNSNPTRLCDALSFYVQEDKEFDGVLGTVSDQMSSELDEKVPSLSGWIVALATERLIEAGLKNVIEIPDLVTKFRAQSADIDISSSYPNGEITMNISKDTTVHELTMIEGLTTDEQRVIGLNMLGGKTNSLEFATKVYKLPHPIEAYRKYKETRFN